MSKKVLIISPHFPPTNAADMHRVRMSLPYFKQFGWDADVVTVDERYSDMSTDELLSGTIPNDVTIYKVKAFNKKWTAKIGLGSIALRSLWFYRKKVDALLKGGTYQLIYFSTTQFPVCVLGDHWKKKFGVPYVIDMQDPWHSEYYQDKPKAERPPKYWFSYRLNKYLEPIAMQNADGLISVSPAYITELQTRYPQLADKPTATIPFGAFGPDMNIAAANASSFPSLLDTTTTNIVYVGRGGKDMHQAIRPLLNAVKQLSNVKALRLYFIGTSYAPAGQGKPSILPLATEYGLTDQVTELTDRISYYHALATLQRADALFIPGSDDPKYSASKLYPYLLTGKPVLAISNSKSPGFKILEEYGLSSNFGYDATIDLEDKIIGFTNELLNGVLKRPVYDPAVLEKYSAQHMTELQCKLFDEVISR